MSRLRRNRSRTTDFHADREFANTVQCPPRPKGCNAPIGKTCRNLGTGDELVNWPAHEARVKRAEAAFETAAKAEQATLADAEPPAPDMEDA